jgi:hypothetical protein
MPTTHDPPDLAPLAGRYPGWHFAAITIRAPGRDTRRLVRAQRGPLRFTASIPARLAARLADAEEASH